jgi:hypothetical protein
VLFPGTGNPAITRLAGSLQCASSKILRESMGIRADLSKNLFFDAALHWKEDMDRLYKKDDKGIRPAKHVAFMAFWIRKIKPITGAYYHHTVMQYATQGKCIPPEEEIIDVNERVAIRLAFDQLAGFAENGELLFHDGETGQDRKLAYDKASFMQAVDRYCRQKHGVDGKCVLETLIYDMRYRSFGPHNLVHIFDQFVFRLFKEPQK